MMSQINGNGKIVISGIDFIASHLRGEQDSSFDVHKLSSLLRIALREFSLECSDEDGGSHVKPTAGIVMGDPMVCTNYYIKVIISSGVPKNS